MKRKELVNKQVIKAMSIGLSATMALTPAMSVPVYADDTNPDQSSTTEAKGASEVQTEATQKAQAEAETSAQTAVDASAPADTTTPQTKNLTDTTAEQELAPVDTATKQTADDAQDFVDNGVLDADDDVVEKALALDDTTATDELKEGSVDADGNPVSNVQDELANTETAADDIDDASKELNKQTQTANDIADDTNKEMKAAETNFNSEVDAINNATNEDDANAAYNNAVDIADDASEKYNEAEKNFKLALDAIEIANKKIDEAQKKYDDALSNAKGDADKAAAELNTLNAAAKLLQEKAGQAAKDVADAAAFDIIKAQEDCDKENKTDWKKQDKLFESIMKNYYVPEVLGMQDGTTISFETVKMSYDSNIPETKDGNANYIVVKYTDKDGNVQEKYYNYKIDANSEAGTRRLVIFEKKENTITLEKAIVEHYEFAVEEGGKIVTTSLDKEEVEDNTTVTGVSSADNLNWGEGDEAQYASNGTSTFKKDAQISDIKEVTEGSVVDGNKKVTTSVTDKEAELAIDQDGNIVKTVTGDVTTVTLVEGVSLAGGNGYESEDAANAAAAEEINSLGSSLETGTATYSVEQVDEKVNVTTITAETTLIYNTSFTTTIDLTGIKKEYDDPNNNAGITDKEKTDGINQLVSSVKETIKNFLEDNNYTNIIFGNADNLTVNASQSNDGWWVFDDYNNRFEVTGGSLSVTYTKIEKKTVPGCIWDVDETIKENAKLSAGSDVLDIKRWNNFQIAKADVYFIEGYTATASASDTTSTENALREQTAQKAMADAKANSLINQTFAQTIQNQVNASKTNKGTVANVNVKTNDTKTTSEDTEETKTSWKYSGTYTSRNEKKENDSLISTTTWAATELTHVDAKDAVTKTGPFSNEYYNNYVKDGDTKGILLVEKDNKDYNDFLNAAKSQKAAYEKLEKDAKDAVESVENAQQKVTDLQAKLKALETESDKSKTLLLAERTNLSVQLDDAKKELEDAEKKKDDILKKLEDAKKNLDDKITELTPPTVPGGGTPEGGATGGTPGGGTTGGTPEGGATGGGAPAGAPAGTTVGGGVTLLAAGAGTLFADAGTLPLDGAGAPAGGGTVETDDEDTTEEGGVADAGVEIDDTLVPMDDLPDEEGVEIEENETPKASTPDLLEQDETNMNWWWLLLIAVLGVAGYEMYRKHQQKRAQEATAKTDGKLDK